MEVKPLTAQQLQVINYAEQHWNTHKEFPSVGLLKTRFGDRYNLEKDLKHPTFKLALDNRGIIIPDPKSNNFPNELTSEQVAAIATVLDFNDKRSRRAKLQALGIPTQRWQGWLKNPVFKKYLHSLAAENFDDSIDIAQEGLVTGLQRGDVNAIKLYLEVTGRYGQESSNLSNIKIVLARVIESIQRHVKDPDTIRSIAQDFEIIMQGGNPLIKQDLKELL